MLDTYACTSEAAKACLQLPEYRRCVECEKDSAFFKDPLRSLVLVYAKQLWSADHDITGSDEVVIACKVFVEEMVASHRKDLSSAGLCHSDLF